jgi:lysyl-tRNA synthetase class 1
MLLLLKRFVGTRAISVTDVPVYMDELDSLEDVYFKKKPTKDRREQEKQSGLYEYCHAMRVPAKPSIHVPYNLWTYLVKVAPKGGEEAYITEKLRNYGYLKQNETLDEPARKRIEYALNWAEDFEAIKETTVELTAEDRKAIAELVNLLAVEDEPDRIQNGIFNVAKAHSMQPNKLFRTIYTILLGVPQGPRLGPYILAMGKQNVVDALNRALGTKNPRGCEQK